LWGSKPEKKVVIADWMKGSEKHFLRILHYGNMMAKGVLKL